MKDDDYFDPSMDTDFLPKCEVKGCPWCGETPYVMLPLWGDKAKGTWIWTIVCSKYKCPMFLKGVSINVRKNQRYSKTWMIKKLNMLLDKWNIRRY